MQEISLKTRTFVKDELSTRSPRGNFGVFKVAINYWLIILTSSTKHRGITAINIPLASYENMMAAHKVSNSIYLISPMPWLDD